MKINYRLEIEYPVFEKEKIKGCVTDIIKDYSGRSYKIISSSPFNEEDCCRLANICN